MTLILLMMGLFFVGVPVAFSLGIASVLSILFDPHAANPLFLPLRMMDGIASFALLAIPFFILTAELMNTSGITDRLFTFAQTLFGHLRGGLGHVNVVASMIFSGMSGSGPADVAGLGRIEIKAMREAGYDAPFSASVTAASGVIGPIIPPSIPLVVYGAIAEESIGKLLLAGAIPGTVMGLSMMLVVAYRAHQRNYPSEPFPGLVVLAVSFARAFLSLLTPIILICGIIAGIFTPTEAAIVAATYALVLAAIVYREMSFARLVRAFAVAGLESAKVLFILSMAFVVSFVITSQNAAAEIVAAVSTIVTGPIGFLIFTNVVFLVLGLVFDLMTAMLIVVPLMLEMAKHFGVDLVHYGVVVVVNLMIGAITPPYGVNMFIACDIAKISMIEFAKESWLFYVVLIIVLGFITFIPELSLFLPSLVAL